MQNKITKGIVSVAAAAALIFGGQALAASAWESVGLKTQYPSEGGTWKYGFENLAIRSYYTVSQCHGSTVKKVENNTVKETSRSINTASGIKSIAEIPTINYSKLSGWYYYRTC